MHQPRQPKSSRNFDVERTLADWCSVRWRFKAYLSKEHKQTETSGQAEVFNCCKSILLLILGLKLFTVCFLFEEQKHWESTSWKWEGRFKIGRYHTLLCPGCKPAANFRREQADNSMVHFQRRRSIQFWGDWLNFSSTFSARLMFSFFYLWKT